MSEGHHGPSRRLALVQRPRARPLARAIRAFLATEASGGVALFAAAVLALIWANFGTDSYREFWTTEIAIHAGPFELTEDLRHWINDGLMSVFFLVVGLEIKRELVRGELQDPRKAALPAIAALGGMVMPALIYLSIAGVGEGARGWGIPMATDIAFAVGVLALMGPRIPASLKIFLLSLAIADDIGAILVIALFYSSGIELLPLGIALGLLTVVVAFKQVGIWQITPYLLLGAATWLAVFESGIHATIAGVALGLLTPVSEAPTRQRKGFALFRHPRNDDQESGDRHDDDSAKTREPRTTPDHPNSVAERLEYALHPWTSYGIVPLFALANAGVQLRPSALTQALNSRVTIGVMLGLVVGKVVGISGFAWLAQRLRLATLTEELRWSQIVGVSAIAGIGFTVALFIGALAFDNSVLQEQAKVGILAGSALSAGVGVLLLRIPGSFEGRSVGRSHTPV